MLIGIDFDNTLICYDRVFQALARDAGLELAEAAPRQKAIRAAAWASAEGDQAWQRLQGQAYGPRIQEAEPMPGALDFLRRCRRQGIPVRVISHKTQRAGIDPSGTDLRAAALDWLAGHGFFAADTGLGPDQVRFGASRAEKIAHIRAEGCTHFIDDLEETFRESDFPAGVERILYGPGQTGGPAGVTLVHSFQQAADALFQQPDPVRIASLLGSPVETLRVLGGGRNSRVFQVTTGDQRSYALKAYFRQPGDSRDRLGTEFRSLELLWRQGLRCVPEPLAQDPEAGLGLYQFIQGEPAATPSPNQLAQAWAFLGALRRLSRQPEAAALAPASEAHFSLAAVTGHIQARLDRLLAQPGPAEFRDFLEAQLVPAWHRFLGPVQDLGPAFSAELALAERTLSPSDFGFHNARVRQGQVVFLDFEYFGWDDPAKLIADFLLHPGMDLARSDRMAVARGILAELADQPGLAARVDLSYPLFGIKWCLILLNEFLPEALDRRHFASAGPSPEQRQTRQLAKARVKLHHLLDDHGTFPRFAS